MIEGYSDHAARDESETLIMRGRIGQFFEPRAAARVERGGVQQCQEKEVELLKTKPKAMSATRVRTQARNVRSPAWHASMPAGGASTPSKPNQLGRFRTQRRPSGSSR
jgi:hypothetical protein